MKKSPVCFSTQHKTANYNIRRDFASWRMKSQCECWGVGLIGLARFQSAKPGGPRPLPEPARPTARVTVSGVSIR
jgi:hypothetical protein